MADFKSVLCHFFSLWLISTLSLILLFHSFLLYLSNSGLKSLANLRVVLSARSSLLLPLCLKAKCYLRILSLNDVIELFSR